MTATTKEEPKAGVIAKELVVVDGLAREGKRNELVNFAIDRTKSVDARVVAINKLNPLDQKEARGALEWLALGGMAEGDELPEPDDIIIAAIKKLDPKISSSTLRKIAEDHIHVDRAVEAHQKLVVLDPNYDEED